MAVGISPHNNKQDIQIAKLQQGLDDFREVFNKFLTNDFEHLRKTVNWIIRTVIFGFLSTILIALISLLAK